MDQSKNISSGFANFPIPAGAGVGLKPEHFQDILESRPDIGWFEIHAENYMGEGGPPHHFLSLIRDRYPISVHGVGLNIGGQGPLDEAHLARLKTVVERYQPFLFSEHLAWSSHDNVFYNDLLPLPYNDETLTSVVTHIDQVQEVVGRQMLLENPASYVAFKSTDMAEIDFLAEVVSRTGCGLLLDVNNVYVAGTNHDYSPWDYLDRFPLEHVSEIHLAGHAVTHEKDGVRVLIDAHDRAVIDKVWGLYERLVAQGVVVPTLIEWDNDLPDWATLYGEARKADKIVDANRVRHDAHV